MIRFSITLVFMLSGCATTINPLMKVHKDNDPRLGCRELGHEIGECLD